MLHLLLGPCHVTAAQMDFTLVIDAWKLECCGPALTPATLLEITLTAVRWPALARLLDWPGVPDAEALVWDDQPTSERDRNDFVVYGSLHGPDRGPRVAVKIITMRTILGDLEPDPTDPVHRTRLRESSLRTVPHTSLPERLGLTASDNPPMVSGPPVVAAALGVHLP